MADASELEEVLDGLIASGALPSPAEAFEVVLGGFTPLTDPDCDPLTAELTGFEFLAGPTAESAVAAAGTRFYDSAGSLPRTPLTSCRASAGRSTETSVNPAADSIAAIALSVCTRSAVPIGG